MKKKLGKTSIPSVNSPLRAKHMNVINKFGSKFVKNRVTKGKINKSGKHIIKPDWTTGFLEYEPNPDAAVHELAHLFLASEGMSLADIQRDMDEQFGYSISEFGYMQQKRTLFEVMPMGMEQKIRRRLGLPASMKHIKVESMDSPIRVLAEDSKTPIAKRIKTKSGQIVDLIRLSSNLDVQANKRLELIDLGILKFDSKRGWYESNSIDAKINKRALKAA